MSSMADNALLLGLLVLIIKDHSPVWYGPALQGVYISAFILLAPWVGVLSEIYSKRLVLIMATAIKLVGALWLWSGGPIFIGYAIVGIGAALYAPAKYGILPELLRKSELVKGNGVMDAANVAALLIGAVLGGILADANPTLFLTFIVSLYSLSLALAYFVKRVAPAQAIQCLAPRLLIQHFMSDVRQLWSVSSAQISLIGTGAFWGADTILKLLLTAWVPYVLSNASASLPSSLTAVVAVGISAGASWAAMKVSLQNNYTVLKYGPLLGLFLLILSLLPCVPSALVLLVGFGFVGGYYVVPLNAQIQEVGHLSIGSGKSIAVQNLIEHLIMLGLVGCYAVLTNFSSASPNTLIATLGVTVSVIFIALYAQRNRF